MGVTFAEGTLLHEVTFLHGDSFARRITLAREDSFTRRVYFARGDIFAQRHFCTQGHFYMTVHFCTESLIARRYIGMATFFQCITFARRYVFTEIFMHYEIFKLLVNFEWSFTFAYLLFFFS